MQMKVFVVIPVHNRAEMTAQCLSDLVNQDFDGEVEVVVVDDGSTDDTANKIELMQREIEDVPKRRITVLEGDGNFWWTKSVAMAFDYLRPLMNTTDFVLLLNDDVRLRKDYLKCLTTANKVNSPCVVMSQLVNIDDHSDSIASPVEVDEKLLKIAATDFHKDNKSQYICSDVAPGRGTLYPAGPIISGIEMNVKQLPHYLADYEFSIRFARLGYPIICSRDSLVFTTLDWGNSKKSKGVLWQLFAQESPNLLRAHWTFWRTWNPKTNPAILFFRLLRYKAMPQVLSLISAQREG